MDSVDDRLGEIEYTTTGGAGGFGDAVESTDSDPPITNLILVVSMDHGSGVGTCIDVGQKRNGITVQCDVIDLRNKLSIITYDFPRRNHL